MFNAGFYPSIVVLCQPSKSEKSKSPVSFSGVEPKVDVKRFDND